jgi:hypothetical protein
MIVCLRCKIPEDAFFLFELLPFIGVVLASSGESCNFLVYIIKLASIQLRGSAHLHVFHCFELIKFLSVDSWAHFAHAHADRIYHCCISRGPRLKWYHLDVTIWLSITWTAATAARAFER